MANSILSKSYVNHNGVDFKSSDLTRPIEFASGMKNAQYRKSGSIEKRKGSQVNAADQGGFGLFTYRRIDPVTEVQGDIIVTVGDKPFRLVDATVAVVYTGGDPTALISIIFDTATDAYRCQILEGAVEVLDFSLGKGFDEASPVDLADLKVAIDALAGFAVTITGTTSISAAFIESVRDHDLSAATGADLSAIAREWVAINVTIAAPFAGSETNKNNLDFENVSATQQSNVLYLANGYDEVQKYDGQTLYRAGLPNVASISAALVGAGSITGTFYRHIAQYVQIDAVGNVIEGNTLKTDTDLAPASESFDITVANVQAGTGFNTNCAIVDGAQGPVNVLAVDNGTGPGGATLQVNDTAYFFDSVSAAFVTRNVDVASGTSITVDGAAVTVADGAVISNNLRIAIFRSKSSGSTPIAFFLVEEIPNDSFNATQVLNDDKLDTALGAQLIEPATDRSPPPKGKYISSFRNIMIVLGNLGRQNTVFFSDIDGVEFFPLGSNEFQVDSTIGDVISGGAPNNEFFAVFKQSSIWVVNGSLPNGQFRVDQITKDIGCVAHATIQELRGSLAFLDSSGPFFMTGGNIPTPLGGERINPVFDGNDMTQELRQDLFGKQTIEETDKFRLRRAIGFNDRDQEKYYLYIPTETVTSGDRHTNSSQKVFAYDYTRDSWLVWDSLDFASGITRATSGLYFQEKRFSAFETDVVHLLSRQFDTGDSLDYQDNDSPISLRYDSQWEPLGEPSVLKSYKSIRIFALEDLPNNDLNLTIEIEGNYIRDVPRTSLVVDFGGGGYGISAYGVAPYGDPAEFAQFTKFGPDKLRSLRFRFLNAEAQANVILTGWELNVAPPFRREFKR